MSSFQFTDKTISIYKSMTKKSKELYEKAIETNPGGVHSSFRWFHPYPFFVSRGDGAYIWDVDGNRYIDFIMGYGALIAGHSPREIIDAIREQLEDGTLYTMPYELQIKLVEELVKRYPMMGGFRISNTGTEAVMHAIKMARIYTGREKIIKVEGTYHGSYDPVKVSEFVRPNQWGSSERPNSVLAPGIPKFYEKDVLVVQFNDIDSLEKIVEEYKDEVAAMILEPVMMNNVGFIKPIGDYLKKVEKILKNNDILMILDEVKTGFRLGYGGATEYFHLNPDIVVLAKALGGGVPISAVGFTKEVSEVIYPLGRYAFSGTYNGNPLVVSAAYANLTKILTRDGHKKLLRLGEYFGKGLEDIVNDLGLNLTISYIGPAGAIHFMDREPINFRDVILNYNLRGYRESWIRLFIKKVLLRGPIDGEPYFVSLAHDIEILDDSLSKVYDAFKELRDEGFI